MPEIAVVSSLWLEIGAQRRRYNDKHAGCAFVDTIFPGC